MHVSGTIGAVGNNATGVVGVNWNVQIMGLKFLSAGGSGSTADATSAVDYATDLRLNHGVNIVLTSNSWGGGGFSNTMQNAIAASGAADMLFVAAAGNSNNDNNASPYYPATYDLDNIISVAATDRNDARASFSSFGATTVDLGAPGVDVRSTTPGDTYSDFNGSSMATPHVSGVAALAWSVAPMASYQTIRDAVTKDNLSLAIDEDQLGDSERSHTTEQVAFIVFDDNPVVDTVDGPFLRRGVVSGASNTGWTTVTLDRTYTSMVVVATPQYNNGPPLVTRVQNASAAERVPTTLRSCPPICRALESTANTSSASLSPRRRQVRG